MIRFVRKALTALLSFPLLAGCTANETAAPAPAPKPALWKLADADTTIYLFGTIHMLPDGTVWRTGALDQALADADSLVLEIVVDSAEAKDAAAMQAMALSPGLPPLAARVEPGDRPALNRMVKDSGVPIAALDRMETWGAALALASTTMAGLNLKPDSGIEHQLVKDFRAAGKPVAGLETPSQQLGYFDALPEAAQRAFLGSVIKSGQGSDAEFQTMVAAWASGDTATIAAQFDDEMKQSPALTDALLRRRNANWSAWLKARLLNPGTVMVAVGAGHLAGADSVQAMLAKDGIAVTRVQ